MTMRPQNQCTDCGYTWYPRGKNLSRRCPNCGSGAVQFSPVSAVVLAGGGLMAVALVTCIGCGGILNLIQGPPPPPDRPVVNRERGFEKVAPDPADEPVPPPTKPIEGGRTKKLVPVRKDEPERKAALLEPTVPAAPERTPVVVEIAPPPRPLSPNRPPAGFAFRWDQCGLIQTRVIGATVVRPVLVKDDGEEVPAPEPVLIIWVETRCLQDGRASLRRWQGTFNDSITLTDADKVPIAPAKFPAGLWLGGQLKGDHSLKPGGAGVVDVLAFKLPQSSARDLWLKLGASHVRESGAFFHAIPYEAWSRK